MTYRGRPVEDLASREDFPAVAYDLIADAPDAGTSRQAFVKNMQSFLVFSPELRDVLSRLPIDTHSMDILAIGLLSAAPLEGCHLARNASSIDRAAYVIAQTAVIAHIISQGCKAVIGQMLTIAPSLSLTEYSQDCRGRRAPISLPVPARSMPFCFFMRNMIKTARP